MIIHKSCGFLLYTESDNKREFLLLRYPQGHWDLVKGHVEGNESELETAKRELEEETGIREIEFIQGFSKTIFYEYEFDNNKHKKEVVFFLAKTLEKKIKLSHEHHDFVWMSYDEALKKITFDNARSVLIEGRAFLDTF